MESKLPTLADFAPPATFDMECRVLASLVGQQELIPSVQGFLREDMFYDEHCKKLYKTIMEMYENRESIDMVTIFPKVEREFFTRYIITKDEFCSELSIVGRVQALNEMAQRRRLYFACIKGLQMSVAEGTTLESMVELPAKLAEEMQEGMSRSTIRTLTEVLNDVAEKIQKGAEVHIPTGFPSLDRLFDGGWGAGQLDILAARPSVGKTAFMLQMVRAAARANYKSLALSLEMTNEELGKRMLYSTERINPYEVSSGRVDWGQFEAAVSELDGEKIYLDETAQSLEEVSSAITIAHQQGKCDIAFIDYLQLMTSNDNAESIYAQVTAMTRRLKKLAKALKIPIILLAQLNRNSVSERRSPQMHDLRDSGSIEQDADKILMLERPADESGDLGNKVIIWVRKNRNGLAGNISVEVAANNSYTKFYEIDRTYDNQ